MLICTWEAGHLVPTTATMYGSCPVVVVGLSNGLWESTTSVFTTLSQPTLTPHTLGTTSKMSQ